jgi:signal peptidase
MIKKILNIIGNILLGILLVIGLSLLVSLLPIKNNYKIYAVLSGSMQPAIKTGSVVLVRPESSYKIGDIITYKKPDSTTQNELVTHRIVEQKQDSGSSYFVTKGDANNGPDEAKVTQDIIVGKMIFNLAFAGYIISYIKTLPGLILIILIPATIIIYEEIKKIHRETKQIISKRREVKKNAKKEIEKKKILKKKVKVLDKKQPKKRRRNVKKT